MNYRQMQGMIKFHRQAEGAFLAIKNESCAQQARARRVRLEREAHALELGSFQREVQGTPFRLYEGDEGALAFAQNALAAMGEG